MIKYQIFISSTFEDLKTERDQVIKAILELDHIPVGMEMFSAADEEQWEIIKSHIQEADYYIVILAHRYGSVANDISYTEKEYDYAISCGTPVLGFIIDESAPWPNTKRDSGDNATDLASKLASFKAKVQKKPVGFWQNSNDLHAKVSTALTKAIRLQKRIGWVRADQARTMEDVSKLANLQETIVRLEREKTALQQLYDTLAQQAQKGKSVPSIATNFVRFYRRAKLEWQILCSQNGLNYDETDELAKRVKLELIAFVEDLDEAKYPLVISHVQHTAQVFDTAIRIIKGFSGPQSVLSQWESSMRQAFMELDTLHIILSSQNWTDQ
jgi:hypothetical protein